MNSLTLIIYSIIFLFLQGLLYLPCHAYDPLEDTCEDENVTIHFSDDVDYRIGCSGYKYAKKFFSNRGYSVDIPITIHFEQTLTADQYGKEYDNDDIYAYCRPDSTHVHVRSLKSSLVLRPNREFFKVKYDPKDPIFSDLKIRGYHKSVVIHEVAHIFAQHNFNRLSRQPPGSAVTLGNAVQEYMAYVVQLSLIDDWNLLFHILQEYDSNIKFDHENQINSMLFSINPEEFGIMAIRHFKSLDGYGQKNILDRMLAGGFDPDLNFHINFSKQNPQITVYYFH